MCSASLCGRWIDPPRKGFRASVRSVRNSGRLLGIFPAGAVAHGFQDMNPEGGGEVAGGIAGIVDFGDQAGQAGVAAGGDPLTFLPDLVLQCEVGPAALTLLGSMPNRPNPPP